MTIERLRTAAAHDAIERGRAVLEALDAMRIDAILETVDALAESYEVKDFELPAEAAGIDKGALAHLSARGIAYPYYFCLPETLVAQPTLIFYYRRLAMLTADELRAVGLDAQQYEVGRAIPGQETARALARLLNGVVSKQVLQSRVAPNTHLLWATANPGR